MGKCIKYMFLSFYRLLQTRSLIIKEDYFLKFYCVVLLDSSIHSCAGCMRYNSNQDTILISLLCHRNDIRVSN